MDQPEHPVEHFLRTATFPESLDYAEMSYLFFCIAYAYELDASIFLGIANDVAAKLPKPTAN